MHNDEAKRLDYQLNFLRKEIKRNQDRVNNGDESWVVYLKLLNEEYERINDIIIKQILLGEDENTTDD